MITDGNLDMALGGRRVGQRATLPADPGWRSLLGKQRTYSQELMIGITSWQKYGAADSRAKIAISS